MTDYLCPEGQRLWEEWDKLRWIPEDDIYADNSPKVAAANKAWVAYQDHRAACQECTKIRIGGHDD